MKHFWYLPIFFLFFPSQFSLILLLIYIINLPLKVQPIYGENAISMQAQ